MTGITPVNLVPNGNGVQLYLGGDFLSDSHCPLSQGQEAVAIAVDGVGVLLCRDRSTARDSREHLLAPLEPGDSDGI